MKVFIAVGVHPRYKRFIDNLPKGFDYEISGMPDVNKYYSPVRTGASLKRFFSLRFASVIVTKLIGLPRMTYYRTGADAIYSTRGIIPINRKPWVVEVEHPYGFVGMDYKLWGFRQKAIVRHSLKSKFCKKIVLVTDAAQKAMEKEFKEPEIRKKMQVVYTTLRYKRIPRKKHKGVTILMVANGGIYTRGFKFLKDAYPDLKKKYKNINLIIKTNDRLLEEDKEFVKTYGVKIIPGNFNENQLDNLFSEADIFMNLSFVDTNSNIMYEAMRAGLVLLSSDLPPLKDKVKDGYNGFVIPIPPLFWKNYKRVKSIDFNYFPTYHNKNVSKILSNRIERLVKNKKLREEMGKRNAKLIEDGKFSMEKRVSQLKDIFEELESK